MHTKEGEKVRPVGKQNWGTEDKRSQGSSCGEVKRRAATGDTRPGQAL